MAILACTCGCFCKSGLRHVCHRCSQVSALPPCHCQQILHCAMLPVQHQAKVACIASAPLHITYTVSQEQSCSPSNCLTYILQQRLLALLPLRFIRYTRCHKSKAAATLTLQLPCQYPPAVRSFVVCSALGMATCVASSPLHLLSQEHTSSSAHRATALPISSSRGCLQCFCFSASAAHGPTVSYTPTAMLTVQLPCLHPPAVRSSAVCSALG
jgi:hypothetical protein